MSSGCSASSPELTSRRHFRDSEGCHGRAFPANRVTAMRRAHYGAVCVQNSTTVPPKTPAQTTTPAETTTPTETTTPAKSTAPATDTIVAVDINDLAFDPPQLAIAPGTRVMFVN